MFNLKLKNLKKNICLKKRYLISKIKDEMKQYLIKKQLFTMKKSPCFSCLRFYFNKCLLSYKANLILKLFVF